ncbi:hypothetical protein B9Q13_05035 [Candidatus Marsarchaeota G2 archaeon ECH_B_SAG-G16]|jgi:Ribosomal protein L37AE/L43A|uniref:Large ribosomal subunit protein eL43 n=5 Tax=Candidatus Marsarchaeota TaxID=1978152 RepID=A0A2R6AK25_9ARCH|nr:MAG: hypothetical protein B9Q01_00355 [Candidatus Marsarchaeota G1 archaeon OSP_D]PSN86726.1 MAG: hypothetical protein B9Q02_00710 [Candidatus Marsarchaeota G1 archaeon BE_D]PSN89704.1 MAG: hypothetical protein B9Q00_00370 [Candidatus Marsarchaeota G1 archaeon OSP_C]PSN91352.1 MAG: hypothetical protein B9P99_04085 [Candidatus Marsarchaeota G1 archaeon OSP_B]PSO04291.1 MAG: hypothetical protein B9Q13_05035 [Candidatus Marsarchaeota G2 archaeon ECH_B_SAG-G16]
MGKTKVVKETGRYGARYGMSLRRRMLKILSERNKKVNCPKCGKIVRMRKLSVGVWKCPRCNYCYAGQAYSPKL